MRLIVVAGCPRSGTSWVQALLASAPGVATTPELHLFADFVHPWLRAWDTMDTKARAVAASLAAGEAPSDRLIGLPVVVDESELLGAARQLLDAVWRTVEAERPDAVALVEKTPSNSVVIGDILRLYPDAVIVHVVRDPRKVAASLMAASRTWASSWAPRSALMAALVWRGYLEVATVESHGSSRIDIRYEDILEDPGRISKVLAEALGVGELDESADERPVVGRDISRQIGDAGLREPDGFGSGGRRHPLTRAERWTVEAVCAAQMRRWGYTPSSRSAVVASRLADLALRPVLRRMPLATKQAMVLRLRHYRVTEIFRSRPS